MIEITALYAGLLALLFLALSAAVIRQRGASRISLGTGDDPGLIGRFRAHGNFAEYVPLGLLLMALVEIGGAPAWHMHLLGLLLLCGRLCHAAGLLRNGMALRVAG